VVFCLLCGYGRQCAAAMSFKLHQDRVFPLLPETQQNLRMQILYNHLPKSGQILCTYLHLLSGADEVSQESWQLVTAIHDEDDCLILCERLIRL
jgi:hypothetical protein